MKYLSFLVLAGVLSGCLPYGPRTDLVFSVAESSGLSPDEPMTFEVLKKTILTPYCISCHKGFEEEKKLLKKIEPGNAEESELFQAVKDGSMPKNGKPLTSEELEIVRRYIDEMKT